MYAQITFLNPFTEKAATRWAEKMTPGEFVNEVSYRVVTKEGEWNGTTVNFKEGGKVMRVETTLESREVRTTLHLRPAHLHKVIPATMNKQYGELEIAR